MTQADVFRIASLLRRLFWRQNDHARKNAKRPSKSNLSDDDSMSAAHSPTIPSSQRSTQRRCQVSKPTQAPQSLSAGKDTLWHAPSDVTSDASTDSTGSSSSDSSDEDSTQDTPLECGSRRPLDLDDKSKADEYGNGHVTQSLV